jgi:chromosome segregation ATPase
LKGRSKGDALGKDGANKANKINNELNLKLKDMEGQLRTCQKNSECLKKKNESLMAEINSFKISKGVEATPDTKSLNSQIENLEAEKWALSNELKTAQDKIETMSHQISELQAYKIRYQILQSDMELKEKEASNLSNRMKEMEISQLKVYL